MKKSIFYGVAIILSLIMSVILASKDNIINLKDKYINSTYTLDDLYLDSWKERDDKFVSINVDPTITVADINGYVNNILFKGTIEGNEEVQIYYTDNEGEFFSEEKSIKIRPQKIGEDIYFLINRFAYNIRIDLYDQPEMEVSIDSIEVNPKKINFSILYLLLSLAIIYTNLTIVKGLVLYRRQISTSWKTFKKYIGLLSNLILRDLKVKYRRSILGFIWSILNPFLMMLIISAVFSSVFKYDIKDFPVYYLTGSLMFGFVSEATSGSLFSVIGAAPLIKKVYIPKYIFPLEKCLFALVNMMFSMIAVAIVFLIFKIEPNWTILLFPIPIIYAFIFSVGLSLMLATWNVFLGM